MTPTRAADMADQAESPPAAWQVTLAFDASGRITANDMPLIRRGPISAGVSGLLHDRDQLAALAGLSVTSADAELIASAYERHGERFFEGLRGSFAIVLLDSSRNVGMVLRDPVGSHPVFYAEVGSTLHVADRFSALQAMPGVSRRLSRLAMADDLCKRWPKPDETIYEGIKRVPHGCRVTLSAAGRRVDRYWNRLAGDVEFLSETEADRFDEQLERAVKRCVMAGPVGIFLSGGFDSISVAAVAADLARRTGHPDPIALSLGFPDPACDERVIQRSRCQGAGPAHHAARLPRSGGAARHSRKLSRAQHVARSAAQQLVDATVHGPRRARPSARRAHHCHRRRRRRMAQRQPVPQGRLVAPRRPGWSLPDGHDVAAIVRRLMADGR